MSQRSCRTTSCECDNPRECVARRYMPPVVLAYSGKLYAAFLSEIGHLVRWQGRESGASADTNGLVMCRSCMLGN